MFDYTNSNITLRGERFLVIGNSSLFLDHVEEDGELDKWVDGAQAVCVGHSTHSMTDRNATDEAFVNHLVLKEVFDADELMRTGEVFQREDDPHDRWFDVSFCIPVTFVGGLSALGTYAIAMSMENAGRVIAVATDFKEFQAVAS